MKAASRIAALALCVAAAMPPAHAAKDPITDQAAWAFWWGDLAALEAQNARLKQPGHFLPDGSAELELFRIGISNVLRDDTKPREPYLRELEALTLQWATEHPSSAMAHIMHANALVAHAWSYRGGGYASEVLPEAWREYHAYLGRAFDYLKAHADIALTDSYAHSVLLEIGKGLDWDRAKLRAIAQDGLRRNPEDITLYFETMTTLLPKWGGTPRALDDFIRSATEQTKAAYGTGMYARLYSAAAEQQYGHALFEQSYVDWDKMKRSYEDMHARYPNSPDRRNRFAYMACLAKDKPTLLALLDELGPKINVELWGPNPERSLEGCQRWARQL